jgi:single-stranded DNA-binding protein
MKIGVEVRIDVTKIDKARLYVGAKGKYLTMTTFIDTDQKDEYENNGFISHKKEKDEQGNTPILGNVKVFWSEQGQSQPQPRQQQAPIPNAHSQSAPVDDFDDDIPF